MKTKEYDVVIIGSGFGGSVAALRLTEKNYNVLVIEAGRRFADDEFAKNSWKLKKFLYFPRLGLNGIQRIDLLRNVMVMSGAGVGGDAISGGAGVNLLLSSTSNSLQTCDILTLIL